MAGKSALPLIIGVGAAALLLGKKKRTSKTGNGKSDPDQVRVQYPDMTSDPTGDSRIVLDQECSQIINKLSYPEHNNWITNRYYQLLSDGLTDLDEMTVQLLKEQSNHCPWDDPSKWTPLMGGLFEQLNAAVKGWHEQTGGQGLPQG